jgi:1,4-dihydroxy-2-naphthoate octaprenyltransferase
MSRPFFLAGTVPLYLLGALAAVRDPRGLVLAPFAVGLVLVLLVQLLTHYYNEYHDVETDRIAAESTLTGGSGALATEAVSPSFAKQLGRATIGLTILVAGSLALVVPAPLVPLTVLGLAMLFGWAYSSPPIRLVARGLGEATVVMMAGIFVPAFAYYLQAGTLGVDLLPVLATLVPLTFAMNISTTLPDRAGDRRTGKQTLAVRLGSRRVADLGLLAFLTGSVLGTWTINWIRPGAWVLGVVVTGSVVLAGWRSFRGARAGDQQAASTLAVIVTIAYGTMVLGFSFVYVAAALSVLLW